LLDLPPEQREQELARRPEAKREPLRQKIQEYLALSPEEREQRLDALELHEYLVPLLGLPAVQRPTYLERVPTQHRAVLHQYLAAWDRLSPGAQREWLAHEANLPHLVSRRTSAPRLPSATLASLPPERREAWERDLAAWNAIPQEQSDQLASHVEKLMRLGPKEQHRTFDTLSPAERLRLTRLFQSLETLSEGERRLCVDSIRRFGGMSPQERLTFLRNAERWRAMSPAERKAWQSLVSALPAPPPAATSTSAAGLPALPGDPPRPPPR
jgi:hypothetical protein